MPASAAHDQPVAGGRQLEPTVPRVWPPAAAAHRRATIPFVTQGPTTPRRAAVRPRVTVAGGTVPRLLEAEVAELLARGEPVSVHLVGAPGSGRSTALAHLAAMFAGDPRLGLSDTDGSSVPGTLITVAAVAQSHGDDVAFELAPWTDDDVLEYLVYADRDRAAAAFAAWQRERIDHGLGRWPGFCRAVLDHLLAERADSVLPALRCLIDDALGAERQLAGELALRRSTTDDAFSIRSPDPKLPLLRVPIVRTLLAADRILQLVVDGTALPLDKIHWSPLLRAALRRELERDLVLAARLQHLCEHAGPSLIGSVLSVSCAAHSAFRPPGSIVELAPHGYYAGADLHSLTLRGALDRANLTSADLRGADLQRLSAVRAVLCGARLDGAALDGIRAIGLRGNDLHAPNARLPMGNLRDADLSRAVLDGASLRAAVLARTCLDGVSLRNADLSDARLMLSHLHGTDLRDACCNHATLAGLDLRTAKLQGATFLAADLSRADLTDTVVEQPKAERANFHRAWLTGTRWPGARLRFARFDHAGLAAVDWEGSDLRDCDFTGATFHLGSSRSGLVHSTIAGEGSRTGFYTDESKEAYIQAPEAVRKANLSRCDLRGAQLAGCDFYLVDLRGARLEPVQVAWLRRCRAILDR